MPPHGVLLEDAADARHDTPYVPPANRCLEHFASPRNPCLNQRGNVHACTNPRDTHTVMCCCTCGFRWDIEGYPVTSERKR